jgi:predicted Zn-dependent peptidase
MSPLVLRLLLPLIAAVGAFWVTGAWPMIPAEPTDGTAEPHTTIRYAPEALQRYDEVRLANGMTAILNARPDTRSVAFYLSVDVGLLDFDCRDRELPHLAEHLMFSGTSTHSEAQLDALIDSLGGTWNARTSAWSTTYWLSIHHAHARRGLATLHEMLTDTAITDQRLAVARDVVHQEAGGKPSWIKQALFRNGIYYGSFNRAYRRFVPASRAFCPFIDTATHLSHNDVERFLLDHYVPANMLLIAVGAFDPAEMTVWLENTFGRLPARVPAEKARPAADVGPQGVRYRTRLAPVIGANAQVGLDFVVPNGFDDRHMALSLLVSYLDQQMFQQVRVERGLGYSPNASLRPYGDVTILSLQARVDAAHAARTRRLMEELVRRLADSGIDRAALARIKRGKLLRLGNTYETNASIAAFYAGHASYFRGHGRFPDLERLIEDVDADAITHLISEHLALEQALRYDGVPTLTYSQLVAVGLLPGAGVMVVWMRRRAVRARRNAESDCLTPF